MSKKYKILMISDHALSTSGVGVQSRYLIEGLIKKECWTVRQFGAALKHTDYRTAVISDDFIIKPIDGFGNPDMIRVALATEKPDILLIFTDPRFFIWLWEMEDEIHQVCPIAYWHVWDNYPRPAYNDVLYKSTDLINCHSHVTYDMVSQEHPERTNFIPHSLPQDVFYPLTDGEIIKWRDQLLGFNRRNNFVAFWANRNAKRKRPADLIWAWSIFINKLREQGKNDATLLMHTDPNDAEGPNLLALCELFNLEDTVVFSKDRVDFAQMNVLHNIADCCVNISYAEGFGLSTLESMQVGNPIIAQKTGGLTRQVVDHRDGSINGVALEPEFKTLVGSQNVPYIYEDYCSAESIAEGFLKLYEMGADKRKILGAKARNYALSEFEYQKTVDLWHDSLLQTVENWKAGKKNVKPYDIIEI